MSLKRKGLLFTVFSITVLLLVSYVCFINGTTTKKLSNGIILSAETIGFGLILLAWKFFIHNSFTHVQDAMGQLIDAREQIENNSAESYFKSVQLAEGAADQASGLEEIAACMEELTAMTSRNAENSLNGKKFMGEVEEVVARSNSSLKEMKAAMDAISQSSVEISQIIKQIGDIAFQTNLLALNAATEAVRAGEYGLGFSVVAKEVRALANRSADASHSSQQLIQDALSKVETGVAVVSRIAGDFNAMMAASSKSATLVNEISNGSQEQREGIEQISKAIAQIDAVVQLNAEQASEGVVISENLDTQTGNLRQCLGNLDRIIIGGHQRKEAEALVKKALKLSQRKGIQFTLESAAEKNGILSKGDELYVYAGSTERATLLAHPIMSEKLVGADLSQTADIKGKKFFTELTELAAKQNAGWVNYWWPKPGEEKPSMKSTYFMTVPDKQVYLACGIYA